MSYPDNNPKSAIGATKVPLHLVPPSATHFLALALRDGGKKYGPYNWRDSAISVSVYYAAAKRHLDAFWDGQDVAKDSGVHHIAHAMACCALILDALTVGKLHDDRPTPGVAARLQDEFVTGGVTGGIPAESTYLASFSPNGSRIAAPAEIDGLRDVLTAEELKGFDIGGVEPATLRGIPDSFTDSHGNRITRRHPMAAEALRDEYERGDGETGL